MFNISKTFMISITFCSIFPFSYSLLVINLNYPELSQSKLTIREILFRYGKMRDYHQNPNLENPLPIFPVVVLSEILAHALNSTLIVSDTFTTKPSILPLGKIIDQNVKRTVPYIWFQNRMNKKLVSDYPTFTQVSSLDYTFVYCSSLRESWVDQWSHKILTETMDRKIWICVAFSMILISTLTGLQLSIRHKYKFSLQWVPTVSALLSPGFTKYRRELKYSRLICVWIQCATILATFYSASVTSSLIQPIQENTVSGNVNSFKQNNYTVLFPNSNLFNQINVTFNQLAPNHKRPLPKLLIFTREFINQATFWIGVGSRYFTAFILEGNHAMIFPWPKAMREMRNLNNFIFTETRAFNKASVFTRKKCFISADLVSNGNRYFGFISPENVNLQKIFQLLVQSGIYKRWDDESVAIAHSFRIQDRIRIKGPALLKKDQLKARPFAIKGKLLRIFRLAGVSVLVSCSVLGLELSLFWTSRLVKVTSETKYICTNKF